MHGKGPGETGDGMEWNGTEREAIACNRRRSRSRSRAGYGGGSMHGGGRRRSETTHIPADGAAS